MLLSSTIFSVFLSVVSPASAPTVDAAKDPVYVKMVGFNHDLRSSQAVIRVHTKLHGFPPLSFSVEGTVYYRAPNKQKVIFTKLPPLIGGMVKDQPELPPPMAWPSSFAISLITHEVGDSWYLMRPKASDSPVVQLQVEVSNATGAPLRYIWENKDGSTIAMANSYTSVHGHLVVTSETGSAHGKLYRADVETQLSNYQFDITIPDQVFAQR